MHLKIQKPVLFFCACLFLFIQSPCKANPETNKHLNLQKDTIPPICVIMPGADVAALSPFSNPLTNTETAEEMETHSACMYQFFKPNDYASIKIELSYLDEANIRTIYISNIENHRSLWERDPERIENVGDSANFSYNADEALCDVCGLTVIKGSYLIGINMKGQFEDVSREKKKQAAIKMAYLLLDRLPVRKDEKNVQ